MAALTIGAPSLLAVDLTAVTQSGVSFVLAEVAEERAALTLTVRDTPATLNDPIVSIMGFASLPRLTDLRIHHAPLIVSYDFLSQAVNLETLVISFGRVDDISFIKNLPDLRVFVLEFCDDWESDIGLPFLVEPLDFRLNRQLEYVGFRLCSLSALPKFIEPPESLKLFDLSFNHLIIRENDSEVLDSYGFLDGIFLEGNLVNPDILESYTFIMLDNSTQNLAEFLDSDDTE
ncbi:MAG: hypothetical protein HN368_06810 [Spirochaetales bacterium]|nr:hypothetical protein [Spirochaetales bacterium]